MKAMEKKNRGEKYVRKDSWMGLDTIRMAGGGEKKG